ncbi:MAG: hypothetical protein ACRCZI_15770 [Cetobacterium sp.]
MDKPQWVQHKSMQGEKYRVSVELSVQWRCDPMGKDEGYYYLPKTDYLLCSPPEVWDDVTSECETGMIYTGISIGSHTISGSMADGYRLRKVELAKDNHGYAAKCWAFIVEKQRC